MDNQFVSTMKQIKNLTNRQKVGVIFFGILILGTLFTMIMFRDEIYFKKTMLTYKDGCTETYVDNRLLGEMCPENSNLKPIEDNYTELNFTLNIT